MIVVLSVLSALARAAAESLDSSSAAAAAPRPHLLLVLGDDLGFYDTQIYNPSSPTPHLKSLAEQGVRLDRHYVFRYCSPTRRSMLSGRFPNHITSVQPDGGNLCSDFLPLATTLLSEKLTSAGYVSHFVGKGHLGYETMDHLPVNRGFKSHVGYLEGSQSYYWGCGSGHGNCSADPRSPGHDMWHDLKPGTDVVSEIFYSANFYTTVATNIIKDHAANYSASTRETLDTPLFLYLPYQNVHSPDQNPAPWETHSYPSWSPGRGEEKTMQICANKCSACGLELNANMLDMLDSGLANVSTALTATGMWSNTLMVFSADNGGVGTLGNNHPLRGHKHDPWEGGVRTVAFMTGGFVPAALRGTTSGAKLIHISDWYPTFCNLGGVDPSDNVMFEGKMRPIDGVDIWPMITGTNTTQPRPLTPVTEVSIVDVSDPKRWWKLITLAGQSGYYTTNATQIHGNAMSNTVCLEAKQADPRQPGRTDPIVNGMAQLKSPDNGCPVCNATLPCLYDILADPSETKNLAAANPDIVARLAPVLQKSNDDQYVTGHLSAEVLAAKYKPIEKSRWQGYLGPCYEPK